MGIANWRAVLPIVAVIAAASLPAIATTAMYATETEATAACGADEVVWVDLDRGRFYEKGHAEYGKSHNGGYSCMKQAHAQYRPGH